MITYNQYTNMAELTSNKKEEEQLVVIQTAAGFAERVVKEQYAAHLGRTLEDVFGDDIGGDPGLCILKARQRSQARDFTLCLGLVPHDYFDENIKDHAQLGEVKRQLMSLMFSAELYHRYLMSQLPESQQTKLNRSTRGTLYIVDAPRETQHIGIIMKPSEESSDDVIHNNKVTQWTPKSPT
jgi:hypothetical protein